MMSPQEAVIACLQDYAKFSGRARRPEYWWFVLFIVVGSLVLGVVDLAIWGPDMLLGFGGLFALFMMVPQLAAAWRRMHDTGRPGWYALLPLAPYIGLLLIGLVLPGATGIIGLLGLATFGLAIAVVVWEVLPSQPGPNAYGPEPPG